MKSKDKTRVVNCVEAEGFDYCFRYYSHFQEIKDDTFHVLREAYVEAAATLAEYLGIED